GRFPLHDTTPATAPIGERADGTGRGRSVSFRNPRQATDQNRSRAVILGRVRSGPGQGGAGPGRRKTTEGFDMMSPREGTRRAGRRRLWAALLAGGLLPAVGCQVEYAGMTLPSGKYMQDDVQYFPPGPEFPWANTNAATQRARMQAMGMDVST